MATALLEPLNAVREAIVAVAMHLSPGYRNARAEAERKQRVDDQADEPPVNAAREYLNRNPSAGARADYGRVNQMYQNRLRGAIAASPNGEVNLDDIIRAPDPEMLNRTENKEHWEREYYRQLAHRQAVERAYAATRPRTPDRDQANRARLNGINSGAPVAGGVGLGTGRVELENEALQFYVSRGVPRAWAAAMVGNLSHESGGMNPRAEGDHRNGRPTAFGLAQWRGPRWARLQAWARQNGKDPMARQTQLEYSLIEADTSAGGNIASLWRQNPNATVAHATRVVADRFEIPAREADGDPLGWDARLAGALRNSGPDVPAGDTSGAAGGSLNVNFGPATVTLQDSRGQTRGTAVLQPVAPPRPAGS
jgi:hypothetical protein